MSFDTLAVLLFWIPLGILGYHWVLFPAVLWIWSRVQPRRYIDVVDPDALRVSLVMAVYNEESIIADKVRNCLDLDYSVDRTEILIGSDSSTDRTEEIIRSFGDARIRLLRFEPQAGKTVVQNRLLQEASGDVVLCTDADSMLTRDSLRLMLAHMRDPRVAVVNPRYVRVNREGSPAEGFYDKWESKVKEFEGRLGAMVGCNAYANMIRKEYATPIPDDTILDDFVLGIRPFRSRMDVVCEPKAIVTTLAESESVEFSRKTRISGGNLQALIRCFCLLSPRYGRKAWVYFSHKVLRMVVPLLLLMMLAGSAIEARHPFFAVLLLLQVAGYITIPLVFASSGRFRRLLIPQYYLLMNVGLVIGYWRYLFRREQYWRKTPRTPFASPHAADEESKRRETVVAETRPR
ncbi:glycosyltransferase [candidate division WOR-3 bacterium]|uniref:Glycosyltransferase n=1 Tax=candidate division WOR-3 bacterium TaxID=2052148 RepID=A0A938BTE8_UNCW3|nr:glycosyltransferase [candidate division WOR-3 bacterium]